MSIKYNNKVIAGKYKEQVIPFANTIDAGIAKIATQEQINEGIDNTSIVTPVYLSQKQDKLTAGEGIDIDVTNTISSKILPDKITIVKNEDSSLSSVARKTVNEKIIFDWEGTQAEYQQALLNGEINPDWYCYITDDEQAVSYEDVLDITLSNIAPEGEEVIKKISKEAQGEEPSTGGVGGGLPMFAHIWSDHIYNDVSYLRADNFSWHYDEIYVTAYNILEEQYNNENSVIKTENGITYKLTPDNFKIADTTQEDVIRTLYETEGIAWFYIIDIENKRFKLPRVNTNTNQYLYFYVGDYKRPETEVDLAQMSEALNNKVDLDGGNYKGSKLEAYIHEHCGSGFNLFDTKTTDHILKDNEATGWALQGTYVSKSLYPDFYNACLVQKQTATEKEITLASSTLTMFVNSNGHQFFNISDKQIVDDFYNVFGIADFYGIDEENERIFLPRNKYFFQLTDDVSKVNEMIEAGLPNIEAFFKGETMLGALTGAFTTSGVTQGDGGNSGAGVTPDSFKMDASLYNPIYGNSDTVQPPSSLKLLYYCVGNTVVNNSEINAGALVAEMEQKANTTLDNVMPTQEFKNQSMLWGIPDYENAIVVKTGANNNTNAFYYTAPSNGLFSAKAISSGATRATATITVNGNPVGTNYSVGASGYNPVASMIAPVSKGDEIAYIVGGTSDVYVQFIPLKGVN